jgi:hypothetical protein
MNLFICTFTDQTKGETARYAQLVFESLDSDSFDRTISPVYVTSEETILSHDTEMDDSTTINTYYNKMNSFMDHVWDGFYTGQIRMSRFVSLVQLERDYNVTYTSTLPTKMRYSLLGTISDTDSISVTVPYVRPYSVRCSLNGVEVKTLLGKPG